MRHVLLHLNMHVPFLVYRLRAQPLQSPGRRTTSFYFVVSHMSWLKGDRLSRAASRSLWGLRLQSLACDATVHESHSLTGDFPLLDQDSFFSATSTTSSPERSVWSWMTRVRRPLSLASKSRLICTLLECAIATNSPFPGLTRRENTLMRW